MDFKLPELGEGVHEGELVKWRVAVGDLVKDDQPLCDIMTDKATIEIPSPFSGKVIALTSKEGQTVSVGQSLIEYEGTGSSATTTKAEAQKPSPQKSTVAASTQTASAAPSLSASSSQDVLASPSTRKLARESGLNLGQISGTGPHGRVLRSDVEQLINGSTNASAQQSAYSNKPTSATRGETKVAFKGLRKKIAEKMRLSKDHAAHFTYVEEADATQLVKLRAQAKEIAAQQGIKLTYLPFVMKAMVAALRKYPILNSSLDEANNELIYKHYFNIGLSIQTNDGLTAPVVKDVEHKSVLEIAKDIQTLVDKARSNKLTLDDFQGGTITLTNAGSIGGLFATPVINYPEVAILGFNKIFKKPVVKTINGVDKVVIRDWTYFSISLDHRVVDGAIGAEFMKLFIQYIENPNLLLLEAL